MNFKKYFRGNFVNNHLNSLKPQKIYSANLDDLLTKEFNIDTEKLLEGIIDLYAN